MYLFAHNCSHIQSSGDKNFPSGRTEVSISLVHHNYPSSEEHSAKGTIQGEKIGKLIQANERNELHSTPRLRLPRSVTISAMYC